MYSKNRALFFCILIFCVAFSYGETLDREAPAVISGDAFGVFPSAASSDTVSAVIWQELQSGSDGARGAMSLTAAITRDGKTWTTRRNFTKPYRYTGSIPNANSLAVNKGGTIAAATLTDIQTISVYVSTNFGESFVEIIPGQQENLIAPRIYATNQGGFVLFAEKYEGDTYSLFISRSETGTVWSDFVPFFPASKLTDTVIPMLTPFSGGDIVFFQATHSNQGKKSIRLYSAISTDSGETWADATPITDDAYNSQRAFAHQAGDTLYLAWERSPLTSDKSDIFVAEVNREGKLIPGTTECLSKSGAASWPVLFSFHSILSVVWSEKGRAYLAQNENGVWTKTTLSPAAENAAFVRPLLPAGGNELAVFWQAGDLPSGKIVRLNASATRLDSSGIDQFTVKIGRFDYRFEVPWKALFRAGFQIQVADIALWSIFVLALFAFAVVVWGLLRSARETNAVRVSSLRGKLVFFTAFLVLLIVLAVSIPLGFSMSANQERVLARGLEERVTVLLDSLASRVRVYLPQQNALELGFLLQETSAIPEVNYATITGFPDFVWATNDPKIAQNIDTPGLTYGASRLTDPRVIESMANLDLLNEQAASSLAGLSGDLTELTKEALTLIALNGDDGDAMERVRDIQTAVASLNEQINQTLTRISKSGEGSLPKFESDKLDRNNTTYLFYKPVMFRQGSGTSDEKQTYAHGMVYVEVSTADLLRSIASARTQVFVTAGAIGLLALLGGILGALVLSHVITKPIRRLASHIALIRDTADKTALKGKDIPVTSTDEIGVLGVTVNDLAHSLIKAAETSRDLTVGKEVQKMFIPLETDANGKKLTTGALEDTHAQFFGYYEASGVSGDYFDYKKLDNRWYAIIKCDVSGKGVPAALIMIEVATIFLNYFDEWEYKTHGTDLAPVVSRINDLIESRGFNGRFAAFTLCLFDSIDGDLHFCNAGDTCVRIYDKEKRKMETINVPSAPAAGVFPNAAIKLQGGFPHFRTRLKKGDVLFLYTDGIEEARKADGEELGAVRVGAIIEAVFARATYTLYSGSGDTPSIGGINGPWLAGMEFDFSTCDGNAADAIMALVSVEKVFRLYKTPDTTASDKVLVDRKIDAYLRTHFKQYGAYCGNRADCPEAPEYLYYTGVKEAPQYDDLTLAAVGRK